jgi:hypothetical protein
VSSNFTPANSVMRPDDALVLNLDRSHHWAPCRNIGTTLIPPVITTKILGAQHGKRVDKTRIDYYMGAHRSEAPTPGPWSAVLPHCKEEESPLEARILKQGGTQTVTNQSTLLRKQIGLKGHRIDRMGKEMPARGFRRVSRRVDGALCRRGGRLCFRQ